MANDRYQESKDHRPDPLDQHGTLDTSGTGGGAHNNIALMSPAFEEARRQELEQAQRALDPKDPTPSSLVVVDEKVAPGYGHSIAAQRIGDALDEANAAAEVRYGSAAYFEANTGESGPRGSQVAGVAGEDGGGTLVEPVNTDLTGTLDTSGTAGLGHPDATSISVQAPKPSAPVEAKPKAEAPAPAKKAAAKKKAPAKKKAAASKS